MIRYILLLSFVQILTSCHTSKRQAMTTTFELGPQDITVQVEPDVFIRGTLEYANTQQLVIFIAGSGPTDRNCNSSMGLQTDAFKMLASHLQSQGISSYRYDKRGIAASTPVEEAELTYDIFVADAVKLVEHFAPNFDRISILGHSEGATIGSQASQSEAVHSFISVSGASIPLHEVIIDQLENTPKLLPAARRHFDELLAGDTLSDVNPMLASLFRPSVLPFLRTAMAVDPATEVSKLSKPVLFIGGKCDLQVPYNHASQLHNSLASSELALIDNMGHCMKSLKADCSNAMMAYQEAALPLHADFQAKVVSFLKSCS